METLDLCVATRYLHEGNGIDLSVAQFARELGKRHNVTLAAVSSDMQIEGVEIAHYPGNNPLKLRAIAKDLDQRRFDLISTHFPPFDLIASLGRTPYLLHDPGIPPLGLMRSPRDVGFWAAFNSSRLIAAGKARAVLPISAYLAREFRRKYFYGRQTKVLPYCIEFPERIPEPACLPFGKYVLYVGRHTPYKGVHTLIDIFANARKELGNDVHLVTIGKAEPSYEAVLRHKAEQAGNVHMLGFVPDVWPYYAGASVYATCSAWEGQDRPVIEAQYAGKPVVSFDNCSHPEVVANGALARDSKAFKEALVKYLSGDVGDPSCKKRMMMRYSPGRMADDFREIVRETVDDNGA
jgi:glycosyltransferase involved in cell wall biosynthesis